MRRIVRARASWLSFVRSPLLSAVGLAAAAVASTGCGAAQSTYVRSETTTLGRVVVYRNGVAYFERYAHVEGDKLSLSVPADKVDDFLKSLNVADAKSGELAPIAYPTQGHTSDTGLIDMQVQLPGAQPHDLKLSYVTESPAWKPSYRASVGPDKKVDLVGWAIVDNTSGEDWKNVKLGVGASSAMSFRFDLRSVRLVERETLQSNDLFAQAPPTGESVYGGGEGFKKVVGDLDDDVIAKDKEEAGNAPESEPMAVASAAPARPQATAQNYKRSYSGAAHGAPAPAAPPPPPPRPSPADPMKTMADRLRSNSGTVVVEGYAAAGDEDKQAASQERANRVRERLVRDGVDPSRIVAVGKGDAPGHPGGARIVEGPALQKAPAQGAPANDASPAAPQDPIGTSHFESTAAMTVPRGTSAMVSILHTATDGEVVYLFDPETPRGNAQFAFKALRLRNPTDSQLESGPVTVFGDGRFVGEGMSEPIPAHQIAFVPFALDRQVVVERKDAERDEIERILTVQRGVFSTQMRHIRKTTLVVHNRMGAKTAVYIRHTVPAGYHSVKAPAGTEHVGTADLYRVEVDGEGQQDVVLEEATEIYRAADIRTPDGVGLVRAYLSSAVLEGPLRGQVDELLKTQKEIGEGETRIATMREQMGEYRQRMDELHAQIVTLRMVRTAGPLMASLEKKMQEMSDKLSRATIDVVSLEEKLMLARIRFQDGVADLTLEALPGPAPAAPPAPLAATRPAGGGGK
jgi:hypothetical protein